MSDVRPHNDEMPMAHNPYAPPKSEVADVAHGQVSPALWNPNAAANWSLLFSPAFGALVHMKNWQALGETAKASAAKVWAIATLVVLVVVSIATGFLPKNKALQGMSRLVTFAMLLAWYFTSGRGQAAFVKERFGTDYPRRGWAKPLVFAIVALVGFVIAMVAIGLAFATSTREV